MFVTHRITALTLRDRSIDMIRSPEHLSNKNEGERSHSTQRIGKLSPCVHWRLRQQQRAYGE